MGYDNEEFIFKIFSEQNIWNILCKKIISTKVIIIIY